MPLQANARHVTSPQCFFSNPPRCGTHTYAPHPSSSLNSRLLTDCPLGARVRISPLSIRSFILHEGTKRLVVGVGDKPGRHCCAPLFCTRNARVQWSRTVNSTLHTYVVMYGTVRQCTHSERYVRGSQSSAACYGSLNKNGCAHVAPALFFTRTAGINSLKSTDPKEHACMYVMCTKRPDKASND
jgi:hypothetical protein